MKDFWEILDVTMVGRAFHIAVWTNAHSLALFQTLTMTTVTFSRT